MKAVCSCETSVSSYQITWGNSSENSHLHSHRREDLKSDLRYKMLLLLFEPIIIIIIIIIIIAIINIVSLIKMAVYCDVEVTVRWILTDVSEMP
jgi:hypothetical protein